MFIVNKSYYPLRCQFFSVSTEECNSPLRPLMLYFPPFTHSTCNQFFFAYLLVQVRGIVLKTQKNQSPEWSRYVDALYTNSSIHNNKLRLMGFSVYPNIRSIVYSSSYFFSKSTCFALAHSPVKETTTTENAP